MSTLDAVVAKTLDLVKKKKLTIERNYLFSDRSESEHTSVREWLEDNTTEAGCCIICALLMGTMLDTNNEDFTYSKIACINLSDMIKAIAKATEIPTAKLARMEMFFERANGWYGIGEYGIVLEEKEKALEFARTVEDPLERFLRIIQNIRDNKTFDYEKLMKLDPLAPDLQEILAKSK